MDVLFNNAAANQSLPLSVKAIAELSQLFETLHQEYCSEDYINKLDAMAAYLKVIMIKIANVNASLAEIAIPDSAIANQATELLLEQGTEFIYNHSLRVFVFGSLNGKRANLKYDAELLYVSSVFHDLGLMPNYSSPDKRFEVDGANAAREFLKGHGLPDQSLQLVWDTIAFHTTIGIAEHKEAEVALMYSGVGLDVMGEGWRFSLTDNRALHLQTVWAGTAGD